MQEIASDIAIRILEFSTEYKKEGGSLVEVDVVHYCPRGDQNKTRLKAEIRRMMRVLPAEDCGDNMAALSARDLWETVRPFYEAWKKNQEIPINGTPIGAWPGCTPAQAKVLKAAGFVTVEEIAKGGTSLGRTGLPGWEVLATQAQAFLKAADRDRAASEIASVRDENAALKDTMAEMQRQMAAILAAQAATASEDKPKRGRPPKVVEPETAEAEAA